MHSTLVDTSTLAEHLDDPRWVVIDCRFSLTDPEAGRRAYAVGHIPGARYAHLNEDLSGTVLPTSGRHPLPPPQALAARFGAWGITAGRQVLAYDDSFGAIAARLWWMLRWLGHREVAVLDGGLPKWTREGRSMTEAAAPMVTADFVPNVAADAWVDTAFVERIREDRGYRLVDVRGEERFNGEVEPLDRVAGHVPGARNLPFEDNLALSGEFLPPGELRSLYAGVLDGVSPREVVYMCGSGVTACHSILAMEHAGLSGARLYPGSWSEWITDPGRPVAADA